MKKLGSKAVGFKVRDDFGLDVRRDNRVVPDRLHVLVFFQCLYENMYF
jgi:hypothetical protein